MTARRLPRFVVVTSIHPPTEAVRAFADLEGWRLVLVGDRKGPAAVDDARIRFLGFGAENGRGLAYAAHAPVNHYARKNLGYLDAIAEGAELIAESDDDNAPLEGWGGDAAFDLGTVRRLSGRRFHNVYREYSAAEVWPRGFPLREVAGSWARPAVESFGPARVAAWQELADDDPDVDAIFRLTRGGVIRFRQEGRLVLGPGTYCPFNSQNTFWRREAYAALYLPSSVSMRYCDILRSYVAQRLFWAHGMVLGFGPATVRQARNPHDLMRDFAEELRMYGEIERVVEVLEETEPRGSMEDGLVQLYRALAAGDLVEGREVEAAAAWADDVRRLQTPSGR
jgi:hypothetical protein